MYATTFCDLAGSSESGGYILSSLVLVILVATPNDHLYNCPTETGLIISVVLNVLLAFAALFKSSLNEILKSWWDQRQQRRRERLQHYLTIYWAIGVGYSSDLVSAEINQLSLANLGTAEAANLLSLPPTTRKTQALHAINMSIPFLPAHLRDRVTQFLQEPENPLQKQGQEYENEKRRLANSYLP